jgi:hypothetical protein
MIMVGDEREDKTSILGDPGELHQIAGRLLLAGEFIAERDSLGVAINLAS